ncbi:hypothetical protein LAD64_23545 [Klebsiella pneumoniae]|nr:hypothetical protein [Klebsiella pneumoniae]
MLNIPRRACVHTAPRQDIALTYAASKAGLVAFAISLAREVAKQNINVNQYARRGSWILRLIRRNIEQNPDSYTSSYSGGPRGPSRKKSDIGVVMVFS